MRLLARKLSFLTAITLLAGCATIDQFSQAAYENSTSLKVEALTMMDKATEPYADNQKSIEALEIDVNKAYEYAKGRPLNKDVTDQWEIIRSGSRNSLGGFLARWKERSTLKSPFIEEAKGVVSDGFDQIIELESGKRKSTDQ